jgi:hypothetical protein
MTKPVWRGRDKNQQGPWNARVMESHLTLAFFYCTDRPWNPYFGSRDVRDRLEAMLTFWCDMQNDDGRFSEYSAKHGTSRRRRSRRSSWADADAAPSRGREGADRPGTAEARDRRGPKGDPRDADDRRPVRARQALHEPVHEHLRGAAAYLDLFPDDAKEIRALLDKKFADADRDFRSPCGYFYEADGRTSATRCTRTTATRG